MRAILLGFLVSAAVGPAAAQSLSGRWDAAMNTPGGVVQFGLILQVKGDTVTGTVKRANGDVPLSGVTWGDSVSFSYTINYNDHPFDLTMTARVAGDSLKGTVDFSGQGSDQFWAHRVVAPASPAPPPVSPGELTARSRSAIPSRRHR